MSINYKVRKINMVLAMRLSIVAYKVKMLGLMV